MTFQSKNLSVLSYANNFTIWHYISDDSLNEVKRNGYFNNAVNMLRDNDLIILNCHDHNTSVWIKSCNNGSVTVTEDTKVGE